jgi:hypothetical protein
MVARAHFPLDSLSGASRFAQDLGLKNLGLSVHAFRRGEGFDFFHNHREQEEVYLCLRGSADLKIKEGDEVECLQLLPGDILRVDAATQRAIGNLHSDDCLVLIAGAAPHPYPAGIGHHDVIADVLQIIGRGETGFRLPDHLATRHEDDLEDC